jgi:hypothetical protein
MEKYVNKKEKANQDRREWHRPELHRLEAGSAEANSAISGRGDGTAQQES